MVTNPTQHSTMANGHATSQLRRTLEHTNDHQTPHTMELDLVRKALDVCHTKAAKRTRRRMHVARFTIQVARRNGWSLNLPALATLILGHAPTQEMRHPKTIMWEISRWQTCLLLSLGSLDLQTSWYVYVIHVQDIVSFLWLTTHPIGAHTREGQLEQLAQWRMGPSNGAMNSQISFNENPVFLVSNSQLYFVSLSTSYLYLHHKVTSKFWGCLNMYITLSFRSLTYFTYIIPFSSTCFFPSSTPCFLSHTSKEPRKKLTAMPCLTTSVLSASTDHLASRATPLAEKKHGPFHTHYWLPFKKMICCGKASTTTCDTLE